MQESCCRVCHILYAFQSVCLEFLPLFISGVVLNLCSIVCLSSHLAGILKLYKHELLQFEVMEDCGRFLSKFPDDVPAEKLVRSTMSVNLTEKEFDQQLERARDKVTGSSQFYS